MNTTRNEKKAEYNKISGRFGQKRPARRERGELRGGDVDVGEFLAEYGGSSKDLRAFTERVNKHANDVLPNSSSSDA